jgi:hypothetical protein
VAQHSPGLTLDWRNRQSFHVIQMESGHYLVQLKNVSMSDTVRVLNQIDALSRSQGMYFQPCWNGWLLTDEQLTWFSLRWGHMNMDQLLCL